MSAAAGGSLPSRCQCGQASMSESFPRPALGVAGTGQPWFLAGRPLPPMTASLARESFYSPGSHWWEVAWNGHCGPQQPRMVTCGQDGPCLPVQVPPASVPEMGAHGSREDEAHCPPGVCTSHAVSAWCGPSLWELREGCPGPTGLGAGRAPSSQPRVWALPVGQSSPV